MSNTPESYAERYFEECGFDKDWFEFSTPQQIERILKKEKDDLKLNVYNHRDCHELITFLKRKYREAVKREKSQKKDFKRKKGFIKINKKKIQNQDCSICFEIPNYSNLVTTNCNHHFCRECYDKWMANSINISNSVSVSCPNCRKLNPKLKQYLVK